MEQSILSNRVIVLRRRGFCGRLAAFLCIVVGVVILFAMVLPAGFWWFLLGVALIVAGFYCANRR